MKFEPSFELGEIGLFTVVEIISTTVNNPNQSWAQSLGMTEKQQVSWSREKLLGQM